jgi:hypothetical protein
LKIQVGHDLPSQNHYQTMLKKSIHFLLIALIAHGLQVKAQCTFQTLQNDGFEYTTPIPDLFPGVAVHSTPMQTGFASGYVAYSGSYAMYLNFVNCNGGLGTCAGAKVYERTYSVCPGMPVRVRAWMTTMFSGANYLQCDMKLVIRDGNGNLLDSVPSLVCPFRTSGGWIEYISDTVISNTGNILFSMYTNVDGGIGNDLTVDNMRLEGCIRTGSTQATAICPNVNSIDLYTKLPGNSVNNGTWSGPSSLTGGYLGTYTAGVNTPGNYYYSSTPYSTNSGCPQRQDTVIALNSTAPNLTLNANDTSICTWQTLTLSASAPGASSYLWSNGSTTASIIASTTGATPNSTTYIVTATNSAGCASTDSVTVTFILCSGLQDPSESTVFSLYPNPAKESLTIKLEQLPLGNTAFRLDDVQGRSVLLVELNQATQTISLPELSSGLYQALIIHEGRVIGKQGLMIR